MFVIDGSDTEKYGVYPLLPVNRMIIGGVKVDEEYGLILMDDYTLSPPEPKKYEIDIPGANGKIDLTDVFGNVVYNNRTDKFNFMTFDVDNVERTKTRISNFLHGQKFEYSYSMDTYDDNGVEKWYRHIGRFEISSYKHEVYMEQTVVIFEISVDSEPFKYRDPVSMIIDATGGVVVNLENSRIKVVPKITHYVPIKIIFNGIEKYYEGTGVIKDPDLELTNVRNDMYINSYPLHYLTWSYLLNKPSGSVLEPDGVTWGEFKDKPLYKWYKIGHDFQEYNEEHPDDPIYLLWWKDLIHRNITWGDFGYKTLSEWYNDGSYHEDDLRTVKIEYERGDL